MEERIGQTLLPSASALRYHSSMSTIKKILPALATALLLASSITGCNDEGGGPTAPPPQNNVNIQGIWTGTASTVTGRGTCLESSFQPVTVTVIWDIRQTGTAVTATEIQNQAQRCRFTGTVSGSSVTLLPDLRNSDSSCGLQNVACSVPTFRPVRIELLPTRSTQLGAVANNSMTLNGNFVWDVFDASSDEDLGELSITTRQELQKQ